MSSLLHALCVIYFTPYEDKTISVLWGSLNCDIRQYLTDALLILGQYINQYFADTRPM